MNRQRFTLIDLAAVVTLSGVGLGVVIQPAIPPKYQDDFKKGQQAALGQAGGLSMEEAQKRCTGNLKMLGTASALYVADNRGSLPGPDPLKWKKGDGPGWDEVLAIQIGASIRLAEEGGGDKTYAKKHRAAKTLAAQLSKAMMPSAPLRFSTMNCWPSAWDSACAAPRSTISGGPLAPLAWKIRTGLLG